MPSVLRSMAAVHPVFLLTLVPDMALKLARRIEEADALREELRRERQAKEYRVAIADDLTLAARLTQDAATAVEATLARFWSQIFGVVFLSTLTGVGMTLIVQSILGWF